jgi:type I restriction enzyme S subunit
MRGFQLAEVGRIVTGKTPKTSRPEYFGGDIPFVTPSDMQEGRVIESTARSLTADGAATVKNSIIPRHAVMVSCIGSDMGKTYLSNGRCVTNQQINSIIVDREKFDPLFIYYNLSGRRSEIRNAAAGAAQPILNKTEFGKILVEAPLLEEQREIAATLGTLDDKIELNRKTAATLEEMARALYRSWFVDFDPVHARAEGRVPVHMDAATAALFPDSFGEDGLPVGWHPEQLRVLCKQVKKTVAPMDSPDADFWHFSLPAFDAGQGAVFERGSQIKSNKLFVPNNAILFSRLNPAIPRVWWARSDHSKGVPAASTEFFVAEARHPEQTPWLYCQLASPEFREQAISRVTGTSNSHQRVSASVLSDILLTAPTADVLAAFGRFAGIWFEDIHALTQENQTLATLRDTLLPRLMSGELRIGAAGELVEEVA